MHVHAYHYRSTYYLYRVSYYGYLVPLVEVERSWGHELPHHLLCHCPPPLLVSTHQVREDTNQLLFQLPSQHLTTLICLCVCVM